MATPDEVTVLVVDDHASGRYLKSKLLTRNGYHVLEASSGYEALTLTSTAQPQVILLDTVLPDLDGFEVCRRLKNASAIQDVMVLQTSAVRMQPMDRLKGLECGADAYLVEPAEDEEILGTVRALVRLAQRQKENRSLLQQLANTERQLADATDAANCGMWDWDIEQDRLQWFGAHERLAGMQPGSFRGSVQVFEDILHPDDRPRVRETIERLMAQQSVKYADEYRFVHPDGTVHWMEARGRFYYDGTRPVRMTGVIRDITEERQTRQALKESEEEFRAMFSTASIGKAQADPFTGRFLRVNATFCALTGYSEDELLQRTVRDITHPDDRQKEATGLAQMVEGEVPNYDVDERYVRRDGRIVWVHVTVNLIHDVAGRPLRTTAVIQDITERKEAEAKLEQMTESLALAQRVSQSGIWDWRLVEHRRPYVSPEYRELYGMGPDEPVTYEKWLTYVHPDDRDRVAEYGRSFFSGKETKYAIEFRIIHPKRGERWIAGIGHLERGVGGEPLRFTGINIDITARRLAAQQLQQRESRLRMALAAGKMATWDVDLRTGKTSWDTKQFELLGLPDKAEAPSLELFVNCVHPDDRARLREAVDGVIQSSGELEVEFRILHPDRQVRWLVGRGMVITDEAGRPERMVGINYDITDRKSMEDQLWTVAQDLDTRVTARTQQLLESQNRLRALATELNLAEQRERKRIAGELHDHLQQMLVLGKLKLGQGKRLAKPIPVCAKLVEETDAILSDALQYTRTLVAELSPPILRDQGFAAGLLSLREYMKKHNLVVTVTLPDKPNWNIPQNDAVLLFQSTRELLINASKYAGTDHAWVTVIENDGTLQIEVLDEGAGFDPAAPQEPTDGGSSQFGLFSIHERMAAMGGAFKIQSSPGKGTKATLELPLHLMEHIAESAPAGPVQEPHEPEKIRPRLVRVLLVDDHAMVRQGLRTVLEGYADIEIAGEAANGQDALMMVDKLQPDVVVMDVNMPGISGIEATATVKHHYPQVGIVGISINTDEEVQLEMKRAGGSALISKEAAVDDLYGAIHQALVA